MANVMFFHYFTISPIILKQVHYYKQKCIGKTLGIHYRGTDKHTESDFISCDTVIENIVSFLSKHRYDTIIVITDEQLFIDKVKQLNYPIVMTNSKKSKNGKPLHFQNNTIQDAMIDSLLLSTCDYVIKTSSCLSDWVKI